MGSTQASPEVELFLEKVRNDILDPNNIKKPKDNLSKEETEALKSLRRDDQNVIRIQDKGSRFVVLDKNDYVEKMSSQLDNELHYNSVSDDPTNSHFSKIGQWCKK